MFHKLGVRILFILFFRIIAKNGTVWRVDGTRGSVESVRAISIHYIVKRGIEMWFLAFVARMLDPGDGEIAR